MDELLLKRGMNVDRLMMLHISVASKFWWKEDFTQKLKRKNSSKFFNIKKVIKNLRCCHLKWIFHSQFLYKFKIFCNNLIINQIISNNAFSSKLNKFLTSTKSRVLVALLELCTIHSQIHNHKSWGIHPFNLSKNRQWFY